MFAQHGTFGIKLEIDKKFLDYAYKSAEIVASGESGDATSEAEMRAAKTAAAVKEQAKARQAAEAKAKAKAMAKAKAKAKAKAAGKAKSAPWSGQEEGAPGPAEFSSQALSTSARQRGAQRELWRTRGAGVQASRAWRNECTDSIAV